MPPRAADKRNSTKSKGKSEGFWGLYKIMLQYLKCLPSELNVQAPADIWRMMGSIFGDTSNEPAAVSDDDIPEEWRFFYGL